MEPKSSTKDVSVLSVSSKFIDSCLTVSKLMQENGIICDITSNRSVRKNEHEFAIETGCRIRFPETEPKEVVETVWPKLKEKFHLDCAHYKVKNNYNGCVNDYKPTSPKACSPKACSPKPSPFLYQ